MASAGSEFAVSSSGAGSSVPPENNDGVVADVSGSELARAGVVSGRTKSPVRHDRLYIFIDLALIRDLDFSLCRTSLPPAPMCGTTSASMLFDNR